jgi:hypothetical protein
MHPEPDERLVEVGVLTDVLGDLEVVGMEVAQFPDRG